MSQIGNALKMYFMLQTKGKMKSREIAGLLETDERTVRRYRGDLEQAGIYIESEKGKHGGYKLLNDNFLLGLNLTENEYLSLLLAEKHLKDIKHITSKDITLITEKVNVLNKNRNLPIDEINNHISKATLPNTDRESERKRLLDIHTAILTGKKLRINYTSLSSGTFNRFVHPYATFQYRGDMYFVGFCEKKKRILDFKMSRINCYEILDEGFDKDEEFNLEAFMSNCIGIYKGTEYKIKLKIEYPMSQIIKEKIWVENQVITEYENGTIIYEASMKGLEEIKSWILGMGSQVKVIEPVEIINAIKKEIKNMGKIY